MSDMRVLTCLSTDSMQMYPDNKISHFRNDVDLQLNPATRYECCLHSISFVKSWYNFFRDEEYTITYKKTSAPDEARPVVIAPGYYSRDEFVAKCENVEQFSEDVAVGHAGPNTLSRGSSQSAGVVHREAKLSWDPTKYKFKIKFESKLVQLANRQHASRKSSALAVPLYDCVVLSKDLARKTGFGDGSEPVTLEWKDKSDSAEYFSTHAINFDPLDYFLLQSSIMSPSHHLGAAMRSVLAVVPCTGEYGMRETFFPKDKLWFEVSKADVNCPEFILSSARGTLMPFEYGTCSCTLLLRPILD